MWVLDNQLYVQCRKLEGHVTHDDDRATLLGLSLVSGLIDYRPATSGYTIDPEVRAIYSSLANVIAEIEQTMTLPTKKLQTTVDHYLRTTNSVKSPILKRIVHHIRTQESGPPSEYLRLSGVKLETTVFGRVPFTKPATCITGDYQDIIDAFKIRRR